MFPPEGGTTNERGLAVTLFAEKSEKRASQGIGGPLTWAGVRCAHSDPGYGCFAPLALQETRTQRIG